MALNDKKKKKIYTHLNYRSGFYVTKTKLLEYQMFYNELQTLFFLLQNVRSLEMLYNTF